MKELLNYLSLEMNGRKIIGTVGALQFEVIQYRLEHEYGAKCSYENLNIFKACWVETDSKKNKEFIDFKKLKSKFIAKDKNQSTSFLIRLIIFIRNDKTKIPYIKVPL